MPSPPADFSRDAQRYWLGRAGATVNPELVGDGVACLNRLCGEIEIPQGFCLTALSPQDLLPRELDELWAMLTAAYGELCECSGQDEPRLVVRRSSYRSAPTAERPPTFLNIVSLEALAAAVYELLSWPSTSRPRRPWVSPLALGGRGRSAVVVQLLTDAEVTARVRPLAEDEVEVRAAWGLGARLADPATPADHFRFDARGRLVAHRIADKERMTVLTDGGVVDAFVPARMRAETCLPLDLAGQAARLYSRARRLIGAALALTVGLVDGELVAVACSTLRDGPDGGLATPAGG